jgi:glycerophosphoryl diester phosphodiesterase
MVRGRSPDGSGRLFADPPVVCGHRGSGSGEVDGNLENTLASFLAAAAAGVSWVEVDARMTADGSLVAHHEPTVADGRFIADLDVHETDEAGLMRLSTLLEELPPEVAIDVEVKTSLDDALRAPERTTAGVTAAALAAEHQRRRLLVTSFDPAALLTVQRVAPTIPVGLITFNRFPLRKAIPAAAHLGARVLAAHVRSFPVGEARDPRERDIVETLGVAHQAGLEVAAWCPPPDQLSLLAEAGVDCVVVDRPAAILQTTR